MNKSPFIVNDGKNIKGIDFTAFGGFEGFLQATSNGAGNTSTGAMLKRVVPDLAHGVDMTAVAVSSLPFEIVDESDEVVDDSENWKNKVGGMKDPSRLLYLLASSLCGGSAYLYPKATNRMVADFQYFTPNSIVPQINQNGLQFFQRSSDLGKSERIEIKDLLYFWLPDSDVEIGPALNHPLGNATLAASSLLNMSGAMNIMAERGFIPPTMLGTKGMPEGAERTKTEEFFNRFLRGWFKVAAKVVNTEVLSVVPLGAGMEALKTSFVEISRQQTEEIAKCFGIPTALFMSDNAFASEFDALVKMWYETSRFKSIYQTIEETFNTQLLNRWDYRLLFRPERLDAFQEDEVKRAASVSSYVNAINTSPDTAKFVMDFMGVDLSEEQGAELEKLIAKKNEAAEKLEEQTKLAQANKPNPNAPLMDMSKEKPKQDKPMPVKTITLNADEVKDLALWRQMATRFFRKGKGMASDFECKALSEEIAGPIRVKLAEAKNELDIVKAFEINQTEMLFAPLEKPNEDIKALAEAINKAVNAIENPI